MLGPSSRGVPQAAMEVCPRWDVRCSHPQGFLLLGIRFLLEGSRPLHTDGRENSVLRIGAWATKLAFSLSPSNKACSSCRLQRSYPGG